MSSLFLDFFSLIGYQRSLSRAPNLIALKLCQDCFEFQSSVAFSHLPLHIFNLSFPIKTSLIKQFIQKAHGIRQDWYNVCLLLPDLRLPLFCISKASYLPFSVIAVGVRERISLQWTAKSWKVSHCLGVGLHLCTVARNLKGFAVQVQITCPDTEKPKACGAKTCCYQKENLALLSEGNRGWASKHNFIYYIS